MRRIYNIKKKWRWPKKKLSEEIEKQTELQGKLVSSQSNLDKTESTKRELEQEIASLKEQLVKTKNEYMEILTTISDILDDITKSSNIDSLKGKLQELSGDSDEVSKVLVSVSNIVELLSKEKDELNLKFADIFPEELPNSEGNFEGNNPMTRPRGGYRYNSTVRKQRSRRKNTSSFKFRKRKSKPVRASTLSTKRLGKFSMNTYSSRRKSSTSN